MASMCSRHICNNFLTLLCQYGPKSLKNVFNNLLNLCHEELRQYWMKKRVQPGTPTLHLFGRWHLESVTHLMQELLPVCTALLLTVSHTQVKWRVRMKCAALVPLLLLMVLSHPEATDRFSGCKGKSVNVYPSHSFLHGGDTFSPPDTYI